MTVFAEQSACVLVGEQVEAVPTDHRAAVDQSSEQADVASGAEQVAGVEVAFVDCPVRRLGELPVVESGTEPPCHDLRMPRAVIIPEPVFGEAQRLRKEPAVAVVLTKEGVDASFNVTTRHSNTGLEVVKGDESQNSVSELGVSVSIDPPEPADVEVTIAAAEYVGS